MGDAFAENDESYALVITEDLIDLYGASHRGLLYAVSTLKQLIEVDAVCPMILFDYPDNEIRGYRVYTPGAGSFDVFKAMVDMLIYYKYNSIIIEVVGAMEYKRRPEINTHWVEFCKEVHKSPYEACRIQHETHPQWKKNSIHADNGDGSFITQEQMRQLIDYCRERELEVIPEVPTLSHCDYIVMTYPEIRERAEEYLPYARHKASLGENVAELVYTTDYFRPYKAFYDGYYIIPEDWTIGQHVLSYTDGTEVRLPIVYGYNIRTASEEDKSDSGSTEARTTSFVEVIGASNPQLLDGKLRYRTAYRNPCPEN